MGFQGEFAFGSFAERKTEGDCEEGCSPVASPTNTPGTAFSHNRIRPPNRGPHARQSNTQQIVNALSAGITGGNSPCDSNARTELKKQRVLSNILTLVLARDEYEGTSWNKMELRGRNYLGFW
jgi:hypothetical protein